MIVSWNISERTDLQTHRLTGDEFHCWKVCQDMCKALLFSKPVTLLQEAGPGNILRASVPRLRQSTLYVGVNYSACSSLMIPLGPHGMPAAVPKNFVRNDSTCPTRRS